MKNPTTIGAMRKDIVGRLTSRVGAREGAAMADLIIEEKTGLKRVDVAVNPEHTVTDITETAVNTIVERVVDGEPLQYVLGFAWFHGLRVDVEKGVLIPRPETSQLIDIITDDVGKRPDLRILDICTGSGAIAAALGRALPFTVLTAVDNSVTALKVARRNFANLGLEADIQNLDILDKPLPDGPFDIIVSNPPYVDESERPEIDPRVLDYEPSEALFVSDNDSLRYYRRIVSQISSGPSLMARGGRLYFEINPRHADEIVRLVEDAGLTDVECLLDFEGRRRFVKGLKP